MPVRGVDWGPADRTGGPIDDVFDALRASLADLRIERLTVTHPGDDDNVWFIGRADRDGEVQIDAAADGAPPFLIESDTAQARAGEVAEAVRLLRDWLGG